MITIILWAITMIVCTFALLIFAMIMVRPVMKIFNWFNKKGWFD